ncbi:MAG: beta-glucuronidase [Candidatus Eisenbacteria bacterium]|uniref:Beta-glucuronidase n=1 Tax=Eiseniibacteriota bacterium TaxID=2212470 RepID=A0A7Y2H0Q6_UNCEI|nr:beta-glucuronidase [Candidatus Eisenbacteria bacterium]
MKLAVAITLIGISLCLSTEANCMEQLTNVASRDGVVLNGEWQIIIDPYNTGSIDYLSRPRENGFWSSPGPKTATDPHEWNFTDDEVLRVPGDWNSQRKDLFFYEGTVWYRRAFDAAPKPDHRYFLCFGGANKSAAVWVNGTKLGEHHVGFTPFHFEVTSLLQAGTNDVTVRVNNVRRHDGVPGMNTDWWNYGGITRDVRLVETPATFVRDLEISFDGNQMTANIRLDGSTSANTNVVLSIEELSVSQEARSDEQGLLSLTIEVGDGMQRWSPENPRLYDVRATTIDDTLTDRIGFRTIETRGSEILLNGEAVFLRGICIHEEALSREGRAHSKSDARELLSLAKELGCNYVRLAHYPHNEAMLRMADELGLLVWAEVPVYWTLDYENPETLAEAKTHLTEMIERDRNRASIIIWSIGNETGDEPVRTAFRRALGEHVKSLDSKRLLSAAMWARAEIEEDRPVRFVVEDPFGEMADVLAINSYIGWYWAKVEDLRENTVDRAWDKPLIISEFGAGMKHGFRGADTERWTEDFGLRIYRETLDWSKRIEGLAGISPWILKDFRSPRRQLSGVQDWYNLKGMVDHLGQRKEVFGLLQEHYRWIEEEWQE